jgi:hypothetical protein
MYAHNQETEHTTCETFRFILISHNISNNNSGVFGGEKNAKSDNFVTYVCPHGTTLLSLHGFS